MEKYALNLHDYITKLLRDVEDDATKENKRAAILHEWFESVSNLPNVVVNEVNLNEERIEFAFLGMVDFSDILYFINECVDCGVNVETI